MSRQCQHLVNTMVHAGVTYELYCKAEPATEFINGWFCALHRPSIVFRGVVDPSPDPAMTMFAAQAKMHLEPKPERQYGLPADPPDIEVRKIRVLKAHKDAVLDTMKDAAAIITASGMDSFAEVMASAVLSAGDSNCWWTVGVRVPGADPLIFGPYATAEAAHKAIEGGAIPAYVQNTQAWVLPMYPAPKGARRKAAAKPKTESTDAA